VSPSRRLTCVFTQLGSEADYRDRTAADKISSLIRFLAMKLKVAQQVIPMRRKNWLFSWTELMGESHWLINVKLLT